VALLQCGVTNAGETNLIVRGDDFGMTQGSLVAFERAFKEGILTCASLQVPAPWFEAAALTTRHQTFNTQRFDSAHRPELVEGHLTPNT